MKKYTIDTLIARGRLHSLRCEDDYLVHESDRFILAAVFDGCSSGVDSHFASTMHKYKMREICKEIDEVTSLYSDDVVKNILGELNRRIWSLDYEVNREMLSTVVFVLIDKCNEMAHICVAGDGCYHMVRDGLDFFDSVHDENGNAVWYLSTVKPSDFNDYFETYCQVESFHINDGDEIAISSDGIESFVSPYGASRNDDAMMVFMQTRKCSERLQKMPLQRLYNVVTKGKWNERIGDEVMLNGDDFTMIKIKCHETEEE